jgi:ABC-type nitrate/sulfonate/bicarbonate transport system substrate-binding protein
MRKSRLLLIFFIIIFCSFLAIINLVKVKKFAISFQAAAANYPMMHAVKGDFFKDVGLDPQVRIFGSADDAQDALLSGSVAVNCLIPLQNIVTIENQRKGSLGIIAFLVSDLEHPVDFLIVPKGSQIKRINDLEGKTIVVFPGTFSESLTRLAFAKNGVFNLNFLKLPAKDMPQALQTHLADAGVVYEPVATFAQVDNWGQVLESGFWEKNLIPEIVIGTYAYNKVQVQKINGLENKIYIAVENAIIDSRRNPNKAKEPLSFYLGIKPEVLTKLPDVRVEMAEEINKNIIIQTLALYKRSGIISNEIDIAPLLARKKMF